MNIFIMARRSTGDSEMIFLILIAAIAASVAAGSFGFAMAGYVMAGRITDVDRIHRDLAIIKTLRG
jgi:hypothetical protein